MHAAALYIIAKTGNNPSTHQLANEKIKRNMYPYHEVLLTKKRNELQI